MHAVTGEPGRIPEVRPPIDPGPTRQGLDAPAPRRPTGPEKRGHTNRRTTEGLYTTGRTPCGDKPERTTPSRSPFGARMQWPEPAYTEQSLARVCAPDEGRCRADPHCTHDGGGRHVHHFSSSFHRVRQLSGASAQATRHIAGSRERPAAISMKLTSYSKTQQASKIVGLRRCRGEAEGRGVPERGGLPQGAAAEHHPHRVDAHGNMRGGWPGRCLRRLLRHPRVERLRRLPDRGQRARSVQLAWEAAHGQGPPDAPGECHSY